MNTVTLARTLSTTTDPAEAARLTATLQELTGDSGYFGTLAEQNWFGAMLVWASSPSKTPAPAYPVALEEVVANALNWSLAEG